jgi:transposase
MGLNLGLMSMKEAMRLAVVRQVLDEGLSQGQAALKLGLSVRQVKRLCRRVRDQGAVGLISKRRGVASNRKVADALREQTLRVLRERYADFGPQLAREYLAAHHGFEQCTETLRGWMIQAGLWMPKARRAQRVHPARPRRACFGELAQVDGSHHDWFEGRSAKCCLVAFIDDATGRVVGARFAPQETTESYFAVLHAVISRHGAPLALYSDRHGIFTKADAEDPQPTQFERALLQLEIESICARTPQAKGRVERLFQTLQDRLVKAMRLEGIDTLEVANDWLPGYVRGHNQRFAVSARENQDMHRAWLGTAEELRAICALHHQRQLSAQGACRFQGQILQLHAGQAHAPKARAQVDIAQHADGRLSLSYRGQLLRHRSFVQHEHLRRDRHADAKTLPAKVDQALSKEPRRLARLKAELAFQDSQRQQGTYRPDTPAILPRAGTKPRPATQAPTA